MRSIEEIDENNLKACERLYELACEKPEILEMIDYEKANPGPAGVVARICTRILENINEKKNYDKSVNELLEEGKSFKEISCILKIKNE